MDYIIHRITFIHIRDVYFVNKIFMIIEKIVSTDIWELEVFVDYVLNVYTALINMNVQDAI